MAITTGVFDRTTRNGQSSMSSDPNDIHAYRGIAQFFNDSFIESIDVTATVMTRYLAEPLTSDISCLALVVTYSDDPQVPPPPPENPLQVLLAQDYLRYEIVERTPWWQGVSSEQDPQIWPFGGYLVWNVREPRYVRERAAIWFVFANLLARNQPEPEWRMFADVGWTLTARQRPQG